MVKFETHTGNDLGTLRLVNGKLVCSTPAVEEIVDQQRAAHGWDAPTTYEWYRSGALDNGYVKATETSG